jgi:hypothetical protein
MSSRILTHTEDRKHTAVFVIAALLRFRIERKSEGDATAVQPCWQSEADKCTDDLKTDLNIQDFFW